MSNTLLYIVWALLYLACGALEIFNAPDWVGILGCIAFFIPPALILWQAWKRDDRKSIRMVRNFSLIWLVVTTVLLILNICSVAMSELAGDVLYYLMVVVSSPMVCGQFWVIGLFGWACLLTTSLKLLKK